jgi:hypothetical protein
VSACGFAGPVSLVMVLGPLCLFSAFLVLSRLSNSC